jgi:cold shock CspA family protein
MFYRKEPLMRQIGFVKRIKNGYCFIRVLSGEEHFAHLRDFKDAQTMKLGQYVEFTPIPAHVPGKNPAATNVVAIAA